MIAHTEWGTNRGTLLKLYWLLIRSKLDYGSFIWQSARRIYLKILNLICHGGLRLVPGDFRTFPIESLYAEAKEDSANIRNNKLATQYYAKLKSSPSNSAYNSAFHPRYREFFEKRKGYKTFWPSDEINATRFWNVCKNILQGIFPETLLWILEKPEVIHTMN